MTFAHRRKHKPKYHKFQNPDPSTAKFAPIVASEILEDIEDKINKKIWEIYRLRPDTVLGIDLTHAVIRELSHKLLDEIVEIDKFEKENKGDLRNYPWGVSDEFIEVEYTGNVPPEDLPE